MADYAIEYERMNNHEPVSIDSLLFMTSLCAMSYSDLKRQWIFVF